MEEKKICKWKPYILQKLKLNDYLVRLSYFEINLNILLWQEKELMAVDEDS